jgi:uncharacterized membrane protein
MSRIIETIEVGVPVRIAYDQWTRFETFPRFLETVDRVVRVDDRTLDWTATSAGKVRHWQAEIVEQRQDEVVSWRSIEGPRNDGTVRFEPRAPDLTLVVMELDVEPEGRVERAGGALRVAERRLRGDLLRFRDFIEAHGRMRS